MATFKGTPGADTITPVAISFGSRYFRGGLFPGPGADVIVAGAGNDTVDGDGGNDTIIGNAGTRHLTRQQRSGRFDRRCRHRHGDLLGVCRRVTVNLSPAWLGSAATRRVIRFLR